MLSVSVRWFSCVFFVQRIPKVSFNFAFSLRRMSRFLCLLHVIDTAINIKSEITNNILYTFTLYLWNVEHGSGENHDETFPRKITGASVKLYQLPASLPAHACPLMAVR